jgi:periplasmic divalent cation tolerance protein
MSSVGSAEEAERLAVTLVQEQLAACVTIVAGALSVYRWKGVLERQQEWMLFIKTTADRLGALQTRVHTLHSYETPEFLVVDIEAASTEYEQWVHRATALVS